MAEPTPDALPASWTLPKLRIDTDGEWYDDDVQITHAGILANLRGNLKKDAQGYFIQTRVRIPVEVADAPLVVGRIERRGDTLHVWLNDGSEQDVDPATVRIGRGDIPYCVVKNGFDARLSRAAAYQLLALADYDERSGRGALRLGGRDYILARAS
ncbi:MAG TPA: hypothetical protein VFW70_16465 [Methylomirabilota bacterium]|nr:hypothetical protein [Methylomirabilota bacterium]